MSQIPTGRQVNRKTYILYNTVLYKALLYKNQWHPIQKDFRASGRRLLQQLFTLTLTEIIFQTKSKLGLQHFAKTNPKSKPNDDPRKPMMQK